MSELPCPLTIGWKERIDFPEFGLRRIRAKIDTGARTSALGAVYYELLDIPGQGRVADLVLALDRKATHQQVRRRVPVVGTVVVRNSTGQCETRPVVETQIRLGPITKTIRLTITHRTGMRFPLILGRLALAGDFVVDVSRKYALRKKKSKT
jgi:hypothetical protein